MLSFKFHYYTFFIGMRQVTYTNNTHIISQQPKMTAINSCIEVDLTGQIVSGSIGYRLYSGKELYILY